MDDKNLFNRQNGKDIRGRINRDQRSIKLNDEPILNEEYSDYQYSEPVDKKINTDNTEKLESKEDSGFSGILNTVSDIFSNKAQENYYKTKSKESNKSGVLPMLARRIEGGDEFFSFLNGIQDTNIASKQGDLIRKNIDLQDKLDYITNTVYKALEAKDYEKQLNTVEDDPEAFNKTHNMYENAMREYYKMKPKSDEYLKELHESTKDINGKSDISGIHKSKDLLDYLQKRSETNKTEIVDKVEDINEEQGIKRYINSIYQISPEYQEKAANTNFAWTDPSTWKYTVPQTLGSSFGFMQSTIAATASSLAGNYLLKQLPKLGMTGGASMLAGLAVTVGASAGNVWANIAARQQESNSEVYDNYKQKLYSEAKQGKFDLSTALKEGAEKLTNEVGIDIKNKTDDQILDDMLMYNINVSTPGFNDVKQNSRKDIDKLYDQNMALAISDVGQSLLIIPGAGKLMSKALTLNGRVKLGENLGKFADKFVNTTTKSIATNMSKLKTVPVVGKVLGNVTQPALKRIVTKGLTPLAKIGIDAVGEMNEEGIQYIQGNKYIADKYKDQPTNIFRAVATNFDATIDAFSGLLGISSDPALNNDVNLAQNMNMGAVVSLVLGGGAQTLTPGEGNVIKDYIDDIAGSKVAKKMTADHIKAKEDMETIKQYAVNGLNNATKREAYINQLEDMKNSLPPGLSAEDIDIEVSRAKKAFTLLDSPVMNEFANSLNINKGSDKYNNLLAISIRASEEASKARSNFNTSKNKYDNIWEDPYVNSFFEDNNIPEDQRGMYLAYIKLNTEKRSLDNFIKELTEMGGSFKDLKDKYGFSYDPTRMSDYQYEAAKLYSELNSSIDKLSKQFEESFGEKPSIDRIDDVEYAASTSLPSLFLNTIRTIEASKLNNAFNNINSGLSFGKNKLSNKNIVSKALDEYENAQALNEEANNLVANGLNTEQKPIVEPLSSDTTVEDTARKAIKPVNQGGVSVNSQISSEPKEISDIHTAAIVRREEVKEKVEKIQSQNEESLLNEPNTADLKEETKPVEQSTDTGEKVSENALKQPIEGIEEGEKNSPESSEDIMSRMTMGPSDEDVVFNPEPTSIPETSSTEEVGIPQDTATEDTKSTPKQEEDKTKTAEYILDNMSTDTPLEAADFFIPDEVADVETKEKVETPLTKEAKELEDKLNATDELPTDQSTLVGETIPDRSKPSEFGLTSGTVFFYGNAMFPGYENAEEFDKFLSTPNSMDGAEIEIRVGNPGDKYNEKFAPNDKSTWDEAAIYVTVTSNTGKKYAGALKTISGALRQYDTSGKEVDNSDIDRLRGFRNSILELYLANGKNTVIKPTTVKRTNGLFNVNRDKNGNAIRRPLTEIKGLNIPKDISTLLDSGIRFGIGKGAKNDFVIAAPTGEALPGVGNSGKIYLYPRKEDVPSQWWSPPIKLNELRFSDSPDLTELLYKTLVENSNGTGAFMLDVNGKKVPANFTNEDVVKMLVREGEGTLVRNEDVQNFGYLTSKQLYYDRKSDNYFVGNNIWTRRYLLTENGKKEFIKYVNDNLHINTDANTMFEQLPFFLYTTMYKYKLNELKLSDSLVFDREDLDVKDFEQGTFGISEYEYKGLKQIEWMVKHGWLLSDLQDQLFKSPFLYVSDPEVVNNSSSSAEQKASQNDIAKEIVQSKDPLKESTDESSDVFLDDPEFRDFFGLDLSMPKKSVGDSARKEHTEESKKWLMNKLGLDEDQVLVGNAYVRAAANGTVVMGTTYRDCIALADATVPGTGYHEAFHRVSTLLLSKSQQDKLYREYRRSHPENYKYTDLQVEEALAEDFRNYMLKREKPIYSILKWFNPIVTFIRKIFKPDAISTIYNMISDGDFSKYKLDADRYNEFENAYKEGLNFTIGEGDNKFNPIAFPDLSSYYNTIKALSATLLYKNSVKSLEDVKKIDASVLRNYIIKAHNSSKNPNKRMAFKEILDHFDSVIMPDIMEELSRLAIRAVDRDRDEEMSEKDASNVQIIQNYDKASYEVSKKDNALARAKMFIGTIVKVNFKYDNVDGVTVKSVVPDIDVITGLPNFIDFDTSWNLMLNNLYDVETWDELVSKTKNLSKNSSFFFQLNKQLSRVTDINLQTQLLQTVKSNKHNMFTVKYGTRPAINGKDVQVYWAVDDSSLDKAARAFPNVWSNVFYNSDAVNIKEEGSSIKESVVSEIESKFNSIVSEVKSKSTILTDAKINSIINDIVLLLNKVGIAVDSATVESALTDPRVSSPKDTRAGALYRLITDTRNGSLKYIFVDNLQSLLTGNQEHKTSKGTNVRSLSNIYEGLGKSSIVGILARHYVQLYPNPEELMVLGSNNNLLYPISQNCYMSDLVRWLNKKESALEQLNAVTYCANSLIREALRQNHDIKLNTFVNFKSETGNDRGRDYMQISPVEDYLSKMTLTANNHIILPTMADKKMYFTISGIRLFNAPVKVVIKDNIYRLEFDSNVLKQFQRVGLDEINAIIEYYNNLKLTGSNKDLQVKNYHTGNKSGGRFRYFTHIAKQVNGKTELISLNDILDKAENEGTLPQTLESIRKKLFSKDSDPEFVLSTINDMLKYLTAAEIASCEQLGIITKNDGVIKNKLLDQSRLADLIEYYEKDPNTKPYAEHYAAVTMISNYALNSALSIIEVEKVFTGDPAFYKSIDDKIKRLSEVLSTGDNLRLDWPVGHRLENRQTFNATELNDNEIASHQFDELKDLFTKSYARKFIGEFYGVQEEDLDKAVAVDGSKETYKDAWKEAERVATISVNAYGLNDKTKKGNINQADAAVYISPQMYKDIMEMLGEWSPEIEKAYAIMEGSEDWLSNPSLYQESLEALIKPLKMMYYGQHLIPELGIQVPIFDKMAMFPMFKVLASGDNRELYNRMNAIGKYEGSNKIDMVAFGSAVKVGSRSPSNFYTDSSNTTISDLNKMSVFKQEFKYLRRQLITDPHHAERQMLGTQVAKAALSNIVMDRVYGEGKKGEKLTGEQIRDIAMNCINQLSNLGVQRIINEIGNEDGTVNVEKLSDYLIRNAKAKGMSSEILEGLKVVNGKFDIPLSALANSKWIESSFVGFTNKEAVDINTPGGAFIQMSSFGFKTINALSENSYNNGKRLNIRNEDGSMDAMISINLFSHIIPNYNRISFLQAKQWLIDNNIIGNQTSVSPVAMGYRIPTQGLSSISSLRIVDVFPSNIGDTIVLPDEFTALTGSDFDIDKLFIARYNYETYDDTDGTLDKNGLLRSVKKARKIEFNEADGFTGNSREALENRLLDMYMMVLNDSNNVDETRLPLDNITSIIKDDILPIVDGKISENDNTYPFKAVSPTFQLNKKYEYSGGKTGIGPFALNNVHHALTQLMGFGFKDNKILNSFGFGRLDGIYSSDTTDYKRDKYGNIIRDSSGAATEYTDRGERILDWLSAMINAHVDVAKDPYVIRLNVVQWTYNMADFLLRSGYGKDTFFFLPQPILKDIAREVQKLNGNYGIDNTKSRTQLEQEAIESIVKQYADKALSLATSESEKEDIDLLVNGDMDDYPIDDIWKTIMDRYYLIDGLIDDHKNNKGFDFYKKQIMVWRAFETLTPYAKELAELVHLSQVDTKNFGNNFNLQRQFLYRVKNFIINNKVFNRKDIIRFYKNTFLDTKIRNSIIFNSNLFNGLMITSTNQFIEQNAKVLNLIGQSTTSDETILKIISNELEAKIKSNFFNSNTSDQFIKDMYYGRNSMAAKLSRIKTDIISGKYPGMLTTQGTISNEFLNYLSSEFKQANEIYDAPNIITIPRIKSNDKYLEKRLTKYWTELLNSPYAEISQFAKDLVTYAFYSSGDNYNKNSFFNLVPNDYRKEMGYTDAIQDYIDKLNDSEYDQNLEDLFLNTWYNDNLVKPIRLGKKDLSLLSSKQVGNTSYPILIAKSFMTPIGVNQNKQPIYKPFVKLNLDNTNNPETTILYKYIGYHTDPNTNEIVPIYAAVNKKGLYQNGKVIREYNDAESSILPFNNLPFKFGDEDVFATENFTDRVGNTRKRYKNVNINGVQTRNNWKNILSSINYVEDYSVFDPVNILTYDDVMNGDYSKLEKYTNREESENMNNTSNNVISRSESKYNRSTAKNNKNTLYVFTDNTDRTSGGLPIEDGWYKQKYGNGGFGSEKNPTTAVLRGLDNAAPISTMRYFYRNHKNMSVDSARWTDSDLQEFKTTIDSEIKDIEDQWDSGKFEKIVVPKSFFNSKISNISKERTPLLYNYLTEKLIELNNYVNNVKNNDKFEELRNEENPNTQTTETNTDDIMSMMTAGSNEIDIQAQGNSLESLVTTNDEGIKQMYITTRREELEEMLQNKTDIEANAAREEFNKIIEEHKDSNSDSLNNALMRLLCK